ncbi:MAG: response regulator [Alphaproteobacteria bacterium]|nr:response regulator [Alphaproteobacteria bacterium]
MEQTMKKTRVDVLIIDDEPMIRELLYECISERGLDVCTAGDGQEGLEKILALTPRLVISDVRMPGMNGYEILHYVKKNHPELEGMKFVLLTGLSATEYVSAAYKIGADEYVVKPIEDTDLFSDRIVNLLKSAASGTDEPSKTPSPANTISTDSLKGFGENVAKSIGRYPSSLCHFVCLDGEGNNLGAGDARWDKLRDHAMGLVVSAARQYCGQEDQFHRCPDNSVLVVFADDSSDRIRITTAQIVDSVNSVLRPSDRTNGVHVEAQISKVGSQTNDGAIGAEQIVSAMHPTARSAAGLENAALQMKANEFHGTAGSETDSPGPLPKRPKPECFPSLRGILSKKFQLLKTNPIRFMYFPIWDIRRRYVGIFGCVPNRDLGTMGGNQWNYGVLGETPEPGEIADLDTACMERALLGAVEHLSNECPSVICPNVHFETISARRGREQVIDLLSSMPSELRDFVSLKVMHIPEGIPETRLAEVLGPLRGLVSSLSVEVSLTDNMLANSHRISRLRSSGFQAILVGLPREARKMHVEIAMETARSIQKVGAISGILGVRDSKLLIELAYSGLDLCGGKAIGVAVRSLPTPYPFDAKNLEQM